MTTFSYRVWGAPRGEQRIPILLNKPTQPVVTNECRPTFHPTRLGYANSATTRACVPACHVSCHHQVETFFKAVLHKDLRLRPQLFAVRQFLLDEELWSTADSPAGSRQTSTDDLIREEMGGGWYDDIQGTPWWKDTETGGFSEGLQNLQKFVASAGRQRHQP